MIDPRNSDELGQRGLERFMAPKEDEGRTNGIVRVFTKQQGRIFEKGLLVLSESQQQPMMFGYDIDERIIDTRERNTYNSDLVLSYLEDYYVELRDKEVMKAILEKAKANPNENFYEYQILQKNIWAIPAEVKMLWRQVFYETFGNDAILSLQSQLNHREAMDREQYAELYGDDDSKLYLYLKQTRKTREMTWGMFRSVDLEEVVRYEIHLENNNLQRLPYALTLLLSEMVYTSRNDIEAIQASEIELGRSDRKNLTRLVKGVYETLAEIIDSTSSDSESAIILNRMVGKDKLQERKKEMLETEESTIRIKHPEFPPLGRIDEVEGEMRTYLVLCKKIWVV